MLTLLFIITLLNLNVRVYYTWPIYRTELDFLGSAADLFSTIPGWNNSGWKYKLYKRLISLLEILHLLEAIIVQFCS